MESGSVQSEAFDKMFQSTLIVADHHADSNLLSGRKISEGIEKKDCEKAAGKSHKEKRHITKILLLHLRLCIS